jgi:hypothetical protein
MDFVMERVNPYDCRVVTRLLDFFGARTPWHRRLWNVGPVLSLKECLEGADAVQQGVMSDGAFKRLCHSLKVAIGKDCGVTPREREILHDSLSDCVAGGAKYKALQYVLELIAPEYLPRWVDILSQEQRRPTPERTAFAIGAHLLDLGYSPTHLHRWLTYLTRHRSPAANLVDIAEDAATLARLPPRTFQALVAFANPPRSRGDMPKE